MNIFLDINIMQLLLLCLSAHILFVTLLVRFIIYFRYKNPIMKIIDTIHKIDKGDFSLRFSEKGNNEFSEITETFNNMMDTIVNDTKELENTIRELQFLTNNIPCGIYKCKDDIVYALTYINNGFADMLGLTIEEILVKKGGKLIDFIHPEDREFVSRHMNIQLAKSNSFETQYRMKHKDESTFWVLNKGICVMNSITGEYELNGILIDTTAFTQMLEKQRKDNENYRIIQEQAGDTIFEWNFDEDSMSYSSNWNSKFYYDPERNNASKSMLYSKNIHPDDLPVFKDWVLETFRGTENTMVEVRLLADKDKYLWTRVRATIVKDEQGNPIKAVGTITDIHHQKVKEEQLLKKAEYDDLTKIYNRSAFEERALKMLEEAKSKNSKLAFLFVDIDDFRYYNSEYGHSLGDRIIIFIGQQIKEVIDGIGFAGRCGGDEFIICLFDENKIDQIDQVAILLIQKLKEGFYDKQYNKKFTVYSSIGIAKYSDETQTYAELISYADEAMYKAKQAGKGCYLFHR